MEKNEENTEIVKVIKATGDNAYKLMEAEDEKAIINAELFDETIKSFVYQPSGMPLTLTINGIMECARRYKSIDVGITKIIKGKESVVAYAYAYNKKDDFRIELAVEQPLKVMTKNGLVSDEFAVVKAQSKAMRNAIRKVVPANHFRAVIQLYMKKKNEEKGDNNGKKTTK